MLGASLSSWEIMPHTILVCTGDIHVDGVLADRLVSNHDAALSKPQNGSSRTAETPKERRSPAVTIHRQSCRRAIVSSLGFTMRLCVRRKSFSLCHIQKVTCRLSARWVRAKPVALIF